MKTRKLLIEYTEYSSIDEMEASDRDLVLAAIDAQKGSYCPYSHFRVGAALRLEDGTVVKGSNQENNAYPAGLCAERTAMFAAGANYPDKVLLPLQLKIVVKRFPVAMFASLGIITVEDFSSIQKAFLVSNDLNQSACGIINR